MAERILVVEDTEGMREVIRDFLELQGYLCDCVDNADSGIELLEKNEYDLVLTDLRLPGKDGFAVIEKANEVMAETPKIIMTGFSDLDDAIKAVKLGAYDFIKKPLPNFNEFGLLLRRALEHGKLLKEREDHLRQIEEMNQQLSKINETLEDEVQRRTTDLQSANQQLRTLDEMKNNLLANISHELRTPLVSVRGYTELFYHGHMGDMPEGANKYLETCLRNIDKLLTLIDSLVRYAELVRDSGPLKLSVVCLNDMIKATVEKFSEQAEQKGCNLHCELMDDDIYVNGDYLHLELVFNNLVENALKFNPEGTEVIIRLEPAGKKLVKISVIDNGVGIAQAEQPKIFERFYQCDGGPTRKFGGTGIGLAIVRDNMRLMGSEVRVSSVVGEGTSFYWTMPVVSDAVKSDETAEL